MFRFTTLLMLLIVSGCTKYGGLAAISPEPGKLAWWDVPRIPTRTPTLQWEAFPRGQDVRKLANGNASRISLVRYQLRLWPEGEDVPHGKINFAEWVATAPVTDVATNSYTVPTPLRPDTRYRWSVRAWYRLDGRLRVTQWSRCTSVDNDFPDTYEVPDAFAFDFTTPKP